MSRRDLVGSELQKDCIVEWGKEVLRLESQALSLGAERLGSAFYEAVQAILNCQGKVVVTGLGKSGHVGAKIASTLSSTGTPAFFLHPSEALHGDFGMIGPQDCVLALAFGGETREVLAVARYARDRHLPVIAITGFQQSSLAQTAHMVLDGRVEREADALDLAPTSSSSLALALGDALAVVLMRCRGFTRENFASLHPGGRLGRSLAHVSQWMHPLANLPVVDEGSDFHGVLQAVTTPNFGIVAVLHKDNGQLQGAISDGDLRRALLKHGAQALEMRACLLMTPHPKTIEANMRAVDAIALMEKFKITSLFVLCKNTKKLIGLVRLHDLLSAKII